MSRSHGGPRPLPARRATPLGVTSPYASGGAGGETSAATAWSPKERETLGMQLLRRELRRMLGRTLRDIRDQHRVGADAVDEEGRYYEFKAHVGDMPDSIGLEPIEFRRAKKRRRTSSSRLLPDSRKAATHSYDSYLTHFARSVGSRRTTFRSTSCATSSGWSTQGMVRPLAEEAAGLTHAGVGASAHARACQLQQRRQLSPPSRMRLSAIS